MEVNRKTSDGEGDMVFMGCDHDGCRAYLTMNHLPSDPPTPRVVGPGDPMITEDDARKFQAMRKAHQAAADALGWSVSTSPHRALCPKHAIFD